MSGPLYSETETAAARRRGHDGGAGSSSDGCSAADGCTGRNDHETRSPGQSVRAAGHAPRRRRRERCQRVQIRYERGGRGNSWPRLGVVTVPVVLFTGNVPGGSRMEYDSMAADGDAFDMSVDVKTFSPDGVVYFAQESAGGDVMAVYLKDGQVTNIFDSLGAVVMAFVARPVGQLPFELQFRAGDNHGPMADQRRVVALG